MRVGANAWIARAERFYDPLLRFMDYELVDKDEKRLCPSDLSMEVLRADKALPWALMRSSTLEPHS